jgi:hypothetical protein
MPNRAERMDDIAETLIEHGVAFDRRFMGEWNDHVIVRIPNLNDVALQVSWIREKDKYAVHCLTGSAARRYYKKELAGIVKTPDSVIRLMPIVRDEWLSAHPEDQEELAEEDRHKRAFAVGCVEGYQ